VAQVAECLQVHSPEFKSEYSTKKKKKASETISKKMERNLECFMSDQILSCHFFQAY
jgi:hypothetical protein